MSALKKISGYKGVATRIKADKIEFFVIAANAAELETVYQSILEDAEPFEREALSNVIVISAADLPMLRKGNFIVSSEPNILDLQPEPDSSQS